MKKYVKIELRNKKFINLSLEKWEQILNDEKGLVAYKPDGESEWSGQTLNKADVVSSEYDPEHTKTMNEDKYVLYRRKSDNTVVKALVGQLPDNLENYEKIS